MQNAQLLSQPIWIVTHALYDVSRRAGSADGNMRVIVDDRLVEDLGDRSVRVPASRSSSAARWTLWVPITTSTWPARWRTRSLVLLRQAARHDDLAAVRCALPRLEVTEVAVELVVGVLADAARVEHDDVGVVLESPAHEPVGLEQAGDPLGVVLVHLAPVGANDIAPRHGTRGYWRARVRHPALATQPSGNVMWPSASLGMCGLWAISHRFPSGSAT